MGERSEPHTGAFNRDFAWYIYLLHTCTSPAHCTFSYMTHSVRYQPILHTLYYTLHTDHAYCLSYRFLNNVVITTVIEMVEMVEILGGRLRKCSVERVSYVANKQFITLGHCEIWSHFTRPLYFHLPSARDNTVATCEISRHISRLCNKSYISVSVVGQKA